jgi:dienelactone hydrolase
MSCPDCFRGDVHAHAEPTGTIETVHGVRTYVAGGSDPARSRSAIIYLPDAFSLKLVNNKLLADRYAAATGCRVLIPDVVPGGGMDPGVMPKMEVVMDPVPNFWGYFAKAWAVVTLLPTVVPFMLFGRPHKVYPQILTYARAVKAELAPAGGKLGVAGFCWGAWPTTKLCVETATADDDDDDKERLVDAQFNGHPSYIADQPEMVVDAVTTHKVPYASAVAADDFQFNRAVAEQTEARVRERTAGSTEDYAYEFRIYEGCEHGFCVRAKESSPASVQGSRDAVQQATDWFNKYLN